MKFFEEKVLIKCSQFFNSLIRINKSVILIYLRRSIVSYNIEVEIYIFVRYLLMNNFNSISDMCSRDICFETESRDIIFSSILFDETEETEEKYSAISEDVIVESKIKKRKHKLDSSLNDHCLKKKEKTNESNESNDKTASLTRIQNKNGARDNNNEIDNIWEEFEKKSIGTMPYRSRIFPINSRGIKGIQYRKTCKYNYTVGPYYDSYLKLFELFNNEMAAKSLNLFLTLKNQRLNNQSCYEILNVVSTGEKKENIKTFEYTNEQITTYLNLKKILTDYRYRTCMLSGAAGTGKTVCLKQLKDDKEINFIYITVQHNLCQDAKIKLSLDQRFIYTWASFIMTILKMNFFLFQQYTRHLNAIDIDDLDELDVISKFPYNSNKMSEIFNSNVKKNWIICIDEFSMINVNEIYVLSLILEQYVGTCSDNLGNIMLLLCGDVNQIQPIFVTKYTNSKVIHNEEKKLKSVNCDVISDNAVCILNKIHYKFEFFRQMRNDNFEYQSFLTNFFNSKTYVQTLVDYFGDKCNVRKIPFQYSIEALLELPIETNNEDYSPYAEWLNSHAKYFNNIVFFSYTNAEAHYINMSVALSAWRQCIDYNEKQNVDCSKKSKILCSSVLPRLVPIYFANSDKEGLFHTGLMDRFETMPFLPLLIGFKYKILYSNDLLKRGQTVILVKIEDNPSASSIVQSLIVINSEDSKRCYRITPGYFKMNLFCQKIGKLEKFKYVSAVTGNVLTAKSGSYRLLYGFPLQMACSDTIRGSIGITVEGDIYASISNCSIEEVYVLLSRTRSADRIKAIAI